MTTFAVAFKDAIRRLARKEIRAAAGPLRRAAAHYRRDIAALKRTVAALQKQLKRGGVVKAGEADAADLAADCARYSARSVRAQRKRLGLSAADFGRLVGASALTVYHWEAGKAKPRAAKLAGFYAVRSLGRREVLARLGIDKSGGRRGRRRGRGE